MALHIDENNEYLELLTVESRGDHTFALYHYMGDDVVADVLRSGNVEGQFLTAAGGFVPEYPGDPSARESLADLDRDAPPFVGLVDVPQGQDVPPEAMQRFVELVSELDPVH